VDMHSDDRTVEIARSLGARVEFFERTGFMEPARAFGVEQATGEWIVRLDADELIPSTLAARLRQVAQTGEADRVTMSCRNFLLGRQLQGTGWQMSADRHTRFFRKGSLGFDDRIHARPEFVSGRDLELPPTEDYAIVHFNYRDVSEFLAKLDRYTTVEARQAAEQGRSRSLLSFAKPAIREAYWRYGRARGFREGWRGAALSWLMLTYRVTTWAKLRELEETGGRASIEATYAQEAERVLAGYASGVAGAPAAAGAPTTEADERRPRITGIIHTLNEERQVARAI
ncbi:glycosyltransferase family 2 protein, partial [Motilibacter deserti]